MFIRNFDSFTVCGRAQWSAHCGRFLCGLRLPGQSPTLCISWFFISQDILWFPIHLGAIWVRCVTKQISMAGFKYQKIFIHAAGIPPYVCQLACLFSLFFKEKEAKGFICYFCVLLRVALLNHPAFSLQGQSLWPREEYFSGKSPPLMILKLLSDTNQN